MLTHNYHNFHQFFLLPGGSSDPVQERLFHGDRHSYQPSTFSYIFSWISIQHTMCVFFMLGLRLFFSSQDFHSFGVALDNIYSTRQYCMFVPCWPCQDLSIHVDCCYSEVKACGKFICVHPISCEIKQGLCNKGLAEKGEKVIKDPLENSLLCIRSDSPWD